MNKFFSVNKIMYIVIILLVAFIIAVIVEGIKKRKINRKLTENYKPPTNIPPNYLKYNTNLTHISNDPTGEPLAFKPENNFNYTQLYYAFLVQLFQALSHQKQKYDTVLVKNYPKNTIDTNARDKLHILMEPLLKRIKEIAPMTNFWIVGYESWRVYQVKDSPLKINQIDCFIFDRIGLTEVRLLLEICELPKLEGVHKYKCRKGSNATNVAKETTPEFPRYYIGYPAFDQLIPLPNEVIVTGNNVENSRGIDYQIPCPFEKIWINWIEIINSSLTLNSLENFKGPQLQGLNKIPFDYTKWEGGNDPYQLPNRVTNQWPTLDTQPKDVKAWPCTPVPFVWDSLGNRPIVNPTRKCPGVRTALTQPPLTTSYDPSMFDYPRKQNQYTWLFNNAKIIPALQYMGA